MNLDLNNMTKEDILKLKPHEIANKYPMADENEFLLLKESIKDYGVQIPIQIYKGKILDGRNRHKALTEVMKENPDWFTPDKVKFEEYTKDDAKLYADHLNLVRRHLTSGQKAILAVKFFEDEYERIKAESAQKKKDAAKQYKAEQKKAAEDPTFVAKPPDRAPTTNKLFGEVVGTNEEYIRKALKIKEVSQLLLDAVYNGNINIDIAFKAVSIKAETDEDKAKKEQLIQELLKGKDFTTTKAELFRAEAKQDKADLNGDLGLFFSFKVPPSTIEKIVNILHDDGYYNQDYTIWVGQDDATRAAVTALESSLKIKKHPMKMKVDA